MDKLISMTDFVLDQMTIFNSIVCEDRFELKNHRTLKTKIENYANFLKQPLTLGMFVPCDFEGNVLEEPKEFQKWLKALEINEFNYWAEGWGECRKYQELKERVLFFGFEFEKRADWVIAYLNESPIWVSWNESKTIEDLVQHNLKLTPTAKKQIEP